jgi:hypothetical protein
MSRASGDPTTTDIDRLHEAVAATIGPTIPRIDNYGWPNQVELALIDAVLSIRANYGNSASTGVRAAVGRYRDDRGDGAPANDLRILAAKAPVELVTILHNRQKSSGKPKADLIVEVAKRLVDVGVITASDVEPRVESQRQAWCGVHGLGPVTWAYFGMLVGQPGVKVDRMIHRFVAGVFNRELSESEATDLVTAVAVRMKVMSPELDHAIWRYQRGKSRS